MKVLITGTAGFIGFHLADRMLAEGYEVVGLDIINDYYDPNLKHARLRQHGIDAKELKELECAYSTTRHNYRFFKADLADYDFVVSMMKKECFDVVLNMAAQAGVRYSIENPRAYTHSNVEGFLSILEGCRQSKVGHLVFASTSSVYGLNTKTPFHEDHLTEHPMTLYAATKKANELMAHSYSHLYRLPTTGLRFFTVYGPWGRPDMALFLFTKAILAGEPIKLFNNGQMIRDYTYVGDIVESVKRVALQPATFDPAWNGQSPRISTSSAPYRIFNIGNSCPVSLMVYVNALEKALGTKAKYQYLPMQDGDVPITYADVASLERHVQFRPCTSVEEGVNRFVKWYRDFSMNQS